MNDIIAVRYCNKHTIVGHIGNEIFSAVQLGVELRLDEGLILVRDVKLQILGRFLESTQEFEFICILYSKLKSSIYLFRLSFLYGKRIVPSNLEIHDFVNNLLVIKLCLGLWTSGGKSFWRIVDYRSEFSLNVHASWRCRRPEESFHVKVKRFLKLALVFHQPQLCNKRFKKKRIL